MNIAMAIFFAILFFILSPGILLRLPNKGSKVTVAATHAVIFGILCFFAGKLFWNLSKKLRFEGFETTLPTNKLQVANSQISLLTEMKSNMSKLNNPIGVNKEATNDLKDKLDKINKRLDESLVIANSYQKQIVAGSKTTTRAPTTQRPTTRAPVVITRAPVVTTRAPVATTRAPVATTTYGNTLAK